MQKNDVYSELNSIRNLMERSTKFISLSGLSGILAGIYALIGAFIGNSITVNQTGLSLVESINLNDPSIWKPLFFIAIIVLVLSISTGLMLTIRQAKKEAERVWNPISKRLLLSLSIPILTGGVLILALIFREHLELICSCCLIFYGLGLVSGSQFTFSDVKWLGFCMVFLGLVAAWIPEYGILFWIIGFGLLHILYGTIMHFKYKQ